MALTHEDLEILKRPFALDEHEFYNGNVYLRENAICNRFDEVDPAWTNDIINTHTRATSDGKLMAVCLMRVTLKGTFRDGVGQASVVTKKDSGFETNEPEKSAATDAIKRAARLFGVGRYLLDARDVENMNDLARWLKGKPQNGKPQVRPTFADNQKLLTAMTKYAVDEGLDNFDLLTALNLAHIDELRYLPCDDTGRAEIKAKIASFKAQAVQA